MTMPHTASNPRFGRRAFLELAGAAGLTMAALRTNARAAPSGTAPNITPQPTSRPEGHADTADILVETLISWGAPFVFGMVGNGINPIIEALRKH
jgi:pyruvate dehydrogenase (quinone)/pyruvate decarboxylase